jgi:hypothetical protein
MNMRMITKRSRVGMQHCCKSRFATEFFVVLGECFQDILNTGEHQRIDFLLIFPGKIPKLAGKGKGDQIVLDRKEFTQLIINPLVTFMVLAMRTTPVAAGMGNVRLFPAVVICALGQHVGAMLLPALLHSL